MDFLRRFAGSIFAFECASKTSWIRRSVASSPAGLPALAAATVPIAQRPPPRYYRFAIDETLARRLSEKNVVATMHR
jgi:hypothetical protein